jgi:hypothetical protein
VFTVNETKFGWAEIAAAAESWGEWQAFVTSVRESLACLHYAAATNQSLPAQELKEMVTAFRYAHHLISGEDVQAWLRNWSLPMNDWMAALRARLLRDAWSAKLQTIVAAYPVSDAALQAALLPHALVTDRLSAWASKLAGRAAIAAASGRFDASDCAPRVLIARIETAFAQETERYVTPARVAAKIANHRLDWVRVGCRYVWFGEERLACEAAFCVLEDGLTLDEVAADARSLVQHWDFYLDEIEATTRPLFLAARPGDWLGPLKLLEGFPLFAVTAKTLPAADDLQICARAEQVLLRTWTEQAVNDYVKWAQ